MNNNKKLFEREVEKKLTNYNIFEGYGSPNKRLKSRNQKKRKV